MPVTVPFGTRRERNKAIWAAGWENRCNFYERVQDTLKIRNGIKIITNRSNLRIQVWRITVKSWYKRYEDAFFVSMVPFWMRLLRYACWCINSALQNTRNNAIMFCKSAHEISALQRQFHISKLSPERGHQYPLSVTTVSKSPDKQRKISLQMLEESIGNDKAFCWKTWRMINFNQIYLSPKFIKIWWHTGSFPCSTGFIRHYFNLKSNQWIY